MNCKQARENFFDAMNQAPSSELATHLSGCSECTAELASLKSTMTLLESWKAPEPSAYFNTRMQARLAEARREEPATSGWLGRLWTPAFLRPALVAAMGLAFVVGMNFYESKVVSPGPSDRIVGNQMERGTAVADLQALDRNQDLYSDFDLLDDIGSNHAPVNPPAQGTGSQL